MSAGIANARVAMATPGAAELKAAASAGAASPAAAHPERVHVLFVSLGSLRPPSFPLSPRPGSQGSGPARAARGPGAQNPRREGPSPGRGFPNLPASEAPPTLSFLGPGMPPLKPVF